MQTLRQAGKVVKCLHCFHQMVWKTQCDKLERSSIRLLSVRWFGIRSNSKPPEPEPEDCCSGGCRHCVWDTYAEELREWEEQVKGERGLPLDEQPQPSISTGTSLHESSDTEPGRVRKPSDIYICECGRPWLR